MSLSQRQQLAAAFQIAADIHGWDQLIYNHFTVRVGDRFLAHPFGLLFSEVTASCLLEVDLATGELVPGQQVHPDAAVDMPFNSTSYVLHSAVYKARPDVACVLHVHVPCIVAVASSESGLVIGLSQESSLIGPVTYHDYEGLATRWEEAESRNPKLFENFLFSLEEQERIIKCLGTTSNVLMLRNHGVLCCGTNVAHAMSVLYHVWRACLVQVDSSKVSRFLLSFVFFFPVLHQIKSLFCRQST